MFYENGFTSVSSWSTKNDLPFFKFDCGFAIKTRVSVFDHLVKNRFIITTKWSKWTEVVKYANDLTKEYRISLGGRVHRQVLKSKKIVKSLHRRNHFFFFPLFSRSRSFRKVQYYFKKAAVFDRRIMFAISIKNYGERRLTVLYSYDKSFNESRRKEKVIEISSTTSPII